MRAGVCSPGRSPANCGAEVSARAHEAWKLWGSSGMLSCPCFKFCGPARAVRERQREPARRRDSKVGRKVGHEPGERAQCSLLILLKLYFPMHILWLFTCTHREPHTCQQSCPIALPQFAHSTLTPELGFSHTLAACLQQLKEQLSYPAATRLLGTQS